MHPDLILRGGKIYAVDAADRVAEAVAITGSRIVAVGSSGEIDALAGPTTRRVHLEGRAVVPGFVDGHPHMDIVGLGLLRPSFEGVTSIEQALEVIRAEVARARPGEWIVCNPLGREPDVFRFPQPLKENRWPTRADLDRVAPDNPVYIEPPMLVAPWVVRNTSMPLAGAPPSYSTCARITP